MSMMDGKKGHQPEGISISNQSNGFIGIYEDFRNLIRNVAQDSGEVILSESEASRKAREMKVSLDDYTQAYAACVKVKKILGHKFITDLINAGRTWQAELGTDEQRIVENDEYIGLEAFFISTGDKLLSRKRGHFGIVYFFGWYETKPLIMRTIPLMEFGKTAEGYQIVNVDFDHTKEAILEYLDIQ